MPNDNFRDAVDYVKAKSEPVDMVIPTKRLFWGWFRYWAGPQHEVPLKKWRYEESGKPLVSEQFSAKDILPGRFFWIIYRTSNKSSDISMIQPLFQSGQLKEEEERRFGRLSVIKAVKMVSETPKSGAT